MTENKRFTYDNKQVAILKNNKFWLEGAIATACNHSEICNELNALVNENEELKDRIDNYNTAFKKLQDLTERKINENEQLKQSVNNLKDTIIKITIAYQRKYDRTIVDLVDEVHDEDITDLIKELQE